MFKRSLKSLAVLLSWSATLLLRCVPIPVAAQDVSYFNQGFLRQPNAAADRTYLGISGGGVGTVTSFSSGNLFPLFSTLVATPTTTPALSYTLTAQAANTVFAGPAAGPNAAPTFRALTTADLSLTFGNLTDAGTDGLTVTGGTGAVIGTGTSLSQHVADSTHNGYLSSGDWATFNGKGSGTVLSVTNASQGAGLSIISTSNAPIPSFKALVAGANVTITDNGGTNLSISSASSSAGTDISMNNLVAYANGTNFALDFSYPASTLVATGDIAFNYSTNWGLSTTSRVCNVYIPATNLLRHVLYLGAATNWQSVPRQMVAVPTGYGCRVLCQVFGPGETNVVLQPVFDNVLVTSNTTTAFNPTNIGGLDLWLDASTKVWQDDQSTVPALNGMEVRSWTDLSGFVGKMTNNSVNAMFTLYRDPNYAPGNIPSVYFTPGMCWMASPTFSALAQPNWEFIMWYGRGGYTITDGLGVNNRFACVPSEGVSTITLYAGTSLNATPAPKVQWMLFAYEANGASSFLRTNGVQAATGNAGTGAPNGFEIGSTDYTLGNYPSAGYVAEVLIYHTNLSSVQVTNVENYFRAKYGAW